MAILDRPGTLDDHTADGYRIPRHQAADIRPSLFAVDAWSVLLRHNYVVLTENLAAHPARTRCPQSPQPVFRSLLFDRVAGIASVYEEIGVDEVERLFRTRHPHHRVASVIRARAPALVYLVTDRIPAGGAQYPRRHREVLLHGRLVTLLLEHALL
mgnify:CR=1 FL=1